MRETLCSKKEKQKRKWRHLVVACLNKKNILKEKSASGEDYPMERSN